MDIKKFLHDNGLKQIDLVNYLKISKPFASQLVHGKANLSVPNLNKLISNPYGWDTSALAAPTITARASGNSKLLGHTSVKTTEIYAHIVDEKKRVAVDNIPKL